MKYLYIFHISCIFLSLNFVACSTDSEHGKKDIYGKWTLEKIVYDDGSVNKLEQGNFVDISKDKIVETIKGHGRRSYTFLREKNILNVMMSSNSNRWEIVRYGVDELQIKTPIGLYVLKR